VKIRIPAGVDTGSRVRIPKKGHGGRLGAEPGDLFIVTNVGKHPFFTRKGENIFVTVPITVPEAALGTKIEVPTVEGRAQLKIPPGTESGQKFSPAGARGFRACEIRNFVEISLLRLRLRCLKLSPRKLKKVLREFEKLNKDNPRKAMGLE
jgi:DnaJ-class molecular chaperone